MVPWIRPLDASGFGFFRWLPLVAGDVGMAIAAAFPASVHDGAIFPVAGHRLPSGSRKSTCDAGDQFGELPTVDRDDSRVRAASNFGEHDLRDGGIRLPFDELRYKRSEVR